VNATKELDQAIGAEKDINVRFGLETLKQAVLRPAKQVIENTGENADVIIERVCNSNKSYMGYNAASGRITNLMAEGVIDPHKVVRCALEYAVSVMGLFLITSAVVAEEKDEKNEKRN